MLASAVFVVIATETFRITAGLFFVIGSVMAGIFNMTALVLFISTDPYIVPHGDYFYGKSFHLMITVFFMTQLSAVIATRTTVYKIGVQENPEIKKRAEYYRDQSRNKKIGAKDSTEIQQPKNLPEKSKISRIKSGQTSGETQNSSKPGLASSAKLRNFCESKKTANPMQRFRASFRRGSSSFRRIYKRNCSLHTAKALKDVQKLQRNFSNSRRYSLDTTLSKISKSSEPIDRPMLRRNKTAYGDLLPARLKLKQTKIGAEAMISQSPVVSNCCSQFPVGMVAVQNGA